ncbi:MAG: serine hydrolase domain-containing protein [Phenylobacterium sp.]
MKRLVLAMALVCAAVGARAAQPAAAPLDRVRVEAFVDGAVRQAMRSDHIAGVTVAIVDGSGVVMTRGYGAASLAPQRPVDADTLFRVGSISKSVVWIALMQLVEQGKIGLDDPINDHLPQGLRVPDEGFSDPIRVRHLMTHTPGFEDSLLGVLFIRDPARLTLMEAYLAAHRVHRVREAGTLAIYSNYGAALAGALVAHVSGQPWQDYAEQHVLRPLGMASATYREPYPQALARARGLPAPMPKATAAHVSTGFAYRGGALEPQGFEYVTEFAPAGALSASANDMARYMAALLDPAVMERAGVLRADTARAMRQALFRNAPGMGAWLHGFIDYSARRGRPGFGHGGDTSFQHSTMEIYPADGLAIFISANTTTGAPLVNALPVDLLAEFASPAPAVPPRAPDAKAQAARVAGTYRALGIASFRTERAVARLAASLRVAALPNGDIRLGSGPGAVRYAPIGGGVFVRTYGPGRVAFREVGGRMRWFNDFSSAAGDRIGVFEQSRWLLMICGLGALVAFWGVASAARRMVTRQADKASLALDGLCLVWLVAGGLFMAAAAPWLGGQSAVVLDYPGRLFPIACWALLAAAIATPLAAVLALGPLRPRGWSWWRWTRQGAALAVFAILAVTLFSWGFLGFSGW